MHGVWLGFAIAVPALGGYIAAAIAKARPLFHGFLVGVVGAPVIFLVTESWLMTVYSLSLFPPSAIIGGWLWQRRQRGGNRAL
jgi:fructose-specific phosphotransferase system IIC component